MGKQHVISFNAEEKELWQELKNKKFTSLPFSKFVKMCFHEKATAIRLNNLGSQKVK